MPALLLLLPQPWGLSPALCSCRDAELPAPAPAGSRSAEGQSILTGMAGRCCCSCSGLGAAQMLDLTVLATIMFCPSLILQKNNLKARAAHRQDAPPGLLGCACGSSSCSSSCPSSNADLPAWREGCRFSFFCLCFSSCVFLGLILSSLKKRQNSGVINSGKAMLCIFSCLNPLL